MNFERQFEEQVISNFVREYAGGRTPLPCAHCNSDLKFATLLERARGLGADHVATGHYARVEHDETTGRYRLRAASMRRRTSRISSSRSIRRSSRVPVSRSARSPSPRCARTRAGSACRWRRSPTARRSASCRMATTPASSRGTRRRPPRAARSPTEPGARARPPRRASIATPWDSGRVCGSPRRSRCTSWRSIPSDRTVVVGPREALEETRLTAVRCQLDRRRSDRKARRRRRPDSPPPRGRRTPACRRCPAVVRTWSLPSRSARSRRARPSCSMLDDEVIGGGWIERTT